MSDRLTKIEVTYQFCFTTETDAIFASAHEELNLITLLLLTWQQMGCPVYLRVSFQPCDMSGVPFDD